VNALKYAADENNEFSFIQSAIDIVATHHEKFDGTGYPNGLAGKKIPLSGRLMAIIDVYDALVHKRVYKDAFSNEEAIAIIKNEKGKHFDPAIVDAFLEIEKDIRNIADMY
jgi:putative two-component system response regulator